MFEIGQWIECEEGIGQVLYVRNKYIEEFEDAGEIDELEGDIFKQYLIIKIFVNHEGKTRKRNRLVYNLSKYCNELTKKQLDLVNKFKKEKPNEYLKYVLSDEKDDLDYIVTIEYRVNEQEKDQVIHSLNQTCWKIWPDFTFDEFKAEFAKTNLKFDFSTKVNGYSKSGESNKIRVMFYSRMMKIVNNKMIFYYAKAIDEESLFN